MLFRAKGREGLKQPDTGRLPLAGLSQMDLLVYRRTKSAAAGESLALMQSRAVMIRREGIATLLQACNGAEGDSAPNKKQPD